LQNHRDNNITGYFVTNGDGVNDNFDHDPRAKIVLMIPFDNDGCVDANRSYALLESDTNGDGRYGEPFAKYNSSDPTNSQELLLQK
jgi:hypothetical protein